MAIRAVDLEFREQAEFFRRKLNMNTEAWTDVYAREHNHAFMVAGANRDDLVADFRQAVESAVVDGESLEEFRKRFDDIVERHGWSYKGGRNWRSRLIYETNINSSYMAGRHEQLMAVREQRPYWEYRHSDAVVNPREHHLAWDGMVLRWDDPWWQTNTPPNGWGCQCRVLAVSERGLRRRGKDGPDEAPPLNMTEREIGQRSPGGPFRVRVPEGVDPGFEFQPGRARENGMMPPPGGTGGTSPRMPPQDSPPPPRPVDAGQLLSGGLSDAGQVTAFLNRFDAAERPRVITDAAGDRIPIGPNLFQDPATGQPRSPMPTRPDLTGLLAEAVLNPDEIWTRIGWHERDRIAEVRRAYVARYQLPGESAPVALAMEFGRYGWRATADEAESWRQGERLFRRESD